MPLAADKAEVDDHDELSLPRIVRILESMGGDEPLSSDEEVPSETEYADDYDDATLYEEEGDMESEEEDEEHLSHNSVSAEFGHSRTRWQHRFSHSVASAVVDPPVQPRKWASLPRKTPGTIQPTSEPRQISQGSGGDASASSTASSKVSRPASPEEDAGIAREHRSRRHYQESGCTETPTQAPERVWQAQLRGLHAEYLQVMAEPVLEQKATESAVVHHQAPRLTPSRDTRNLHQGNDGSSASARAGARSSKRGSVTRKPAETAQLMSEPMQLSQGSGGDASAPSKASSKVPQRASPKEEDVGIAREPRSQRHHNLRRRASRRDARNLREGSDGSSASTRQAPARPLSHVYAPTWPGD